MIMNRIYRYCLLVITLGVCTSLQAQNYPEKDSEGEKIYYKIKSASSSYTNKCIEDNNRNSQTSLYKFLITDINNENEFQEWTFTAGSDKETYYIRNKKSMRYIDSDGTWIFNYLHPNNAASKSAAYPFEFGPLEGKQIAIKYVDKNGHDCYLGVADSAQAPARFSSYNIANSPWAWTITDPAGNPVSVQDIRMNAPQANVYVKDHHIIVKSDEEYTIIDSQGRPVSKDGQKTPGIYVVTFAESAVKVVVK